MATKKRPANAAEVQQLRKELEQAKARIGEEMETNARLRAENGKLCRENAHLQSAISSALSENARIGEHSRKQEKVIEKLKAGLDGLIDSSQLDRSSLVRLVGGH